MGFRNGTLKIINSLMAVPLLFTLAMPPQLAFASKNSEEDSLLEDIKQQQKDLRDEEKRVKKEITEKTRLRDELVNGAWQNDPAFTGMSAPCDCRPSASIGCSESFWTEKMKIKPAELEKLKNGDEDGCVAIYAKFPGLSSDGVPTACAEQASSCGVIRQKKMIAQLNREIASNQSWLKDQLPDLKKDLLADLKEARKNCENCGAKGAATMMQSRTPSIGEDIVMGLGAITPMVLGGMGLYANSQALNSYTHNYGAYLNQCMTVGVPCGGPMYGGGGGMGMMGGGFGMMMGGGGMMSGMMGGGGLVMVGGGGYPGMMMGGGGMMMGGSIFMGGSMMAGGYPGMMMGGYPVMVGGGGYPGMMMGGYPGMMMGGGSIFMGGSMMAGGPGMMMGGLYPASPVFTTGYGMPMYPYGTGFGSPIFPMGPVGSMTGMMMGMMGGGMMGMMGGGMPGMMGGGMMGMMGGGMAGMMTGFYPSPGMMGGGAMMGMMGGGMRGMMGGGGMMGMMGGGMPGMMGGGMMGMMGGGMAGMMGGGYGMMGGNPQYSALLQSSMQQQQMQAQQAAQSQQDLMIAQQQIFEAQSRYYQLSAGGYGFGMMGGGGGMMSGGSMGGMRQF